MVRGVKWGRGWLRVLEGGKRGSRVVKGGGKICVVGVVKWVGGGKVSFCRY